MEKMGFYNKLKTVPENVKKTIKGGRIAGMTDIKPQWRIEIMTEVFGPVGFGWKYTINKTWFSEPDSFGQVACFAEVDVYVKDGDVWSAPIPGIGGNMFISLERNGLYTSDECLKMAITDALSVAMKAIGVGADVYMGHDGKYASKDEAQGAEAKTPPSQQKQPAQTNKPAISVGDGNYKKVVKALFERTADMEYAKTKFNISSDVESSIFADVKKMFDDALELEKKKQGEMAEKPAEPAEKTKITIKVGDINFNAIADRIATGTSTIEKEKEWFHITPSVEKKINEFASAIKGQKGGAA